MRRAPIYGAVLVLGTVAGYQCAAATSATDAMIAFLAIGAVLAFIALLPVASWLAIGRIRRGLPPGTRKAIRDARRRYRLQLPDDRVWCPRARSDWS